MRSPRSGGTAGFEFLGPGSALRFTGDAELGAGAIKGAAGKVMVDTGKTLTVAADTFAADSTITLDGGGTLAVPAGGLTTNAKLNVKNAILDVTKVNSASTVSQNDVIMHADSTLKVAVPNDLSKSFATFSDLIIRSPLHFTIDFDKAYDQWPLTNASLTATVLEAASLKTGYNPDNFSPNDANGINYKVGNNNLTSPKPTTDENSNPRLAVVFNQGNVPVALTLTAKAQYDITVTDGTATPDMAAEGAIIAIEADPAPNGQQFKQWIVNRGNVTLADASAATTTFQMPAESVSLQATFEDKSTEPDPTPTPTPTPTSTPTPVASPTPTPPTGTEPTGTDPGNSPGVKMTKQPPVWTKGSNKPASFTSSAEFKDFLHVKVDNKVVDESNYDAKEGSTVVTFKPAFLETLSAGNHPVEIVSASGSAYGNIEIKAKSSQGTIEVTESSDTIPKTGENSGQYPWLALLLLSAGGLIFFARKKRISKQGD